MRSMIMKRVLVAIMALALVIALWPMEAGFAFGEETAATPAETVGGQEDANDPQEEPSGIEQEPQQETPKESDTPEAPVTMQGKVQDVPTVLPNVLHRSRTSVVIRAEAGIEYTIDGGKTIRKAGNGATTIAFLDLKPGTTYTVQSRTPRSAEADPSPWNAGTRVTTLSAPGKLVVNATKKGPKLNYSSIRATRGQSFQLVLTGSKKGKLVKLKKAKKKIIAVKKTGKNKWKVTLLAPGSATIKIKVKGKKYKCAVKVLPYKIGKHDNQFFAHRGLANNFPENSRVALTKGMQAGFVGTNFDLWPSKPDSKGNFEFIVSHDNQLKDMTSTKGLITGTTAAKILKLKVTKGKNAKKYNQRMMRMEDAIAITDKYKGKGQIEMKSNPGKPWTRKQTDELAKRLNKVAHPERYEVEAMDPASLRNFRDSKKNYSRLSRVKLNLVCAELSGNTTSYAKACVKLRFDNMPTYYGKITKNVVKDCRSKGIGISGYAHINEDSNLVAKKTESLDLDALIVPSIPWSSGK